MVTKRLSRRARWLLALIVLAVAAPALWIYATRHGVTSANFELLHDGMSRSEVEAALGGPPGSYSMPSWFLWADQKITASSGQRPIWSVHAKWGILPAAVNSLSYWKAPGIMIQVYFDDEERARGALLFARD
jgi:hypothetical protein